MSIRNNILTIILFAMSVCGYAQNFQVNARIDSTVIYIGQQCNVTFDISQRPDLKVVTPVFKDTLAKGIEIIEYTTDTIADKDGYITVRQNYLVTAFDSALYYIPEFPFVAGGDTVFSYSLSLKVLTVPVDTTSQEIVINDIKPIVEPPINWSSLITKIAIGVVVFAILLVVVLLVVRHLRKRKMQPIIVEKTPERVKTCEEIALEKLETVRREKIWQAGRVKEYYTDITDVLREYIEARFGIVAFERTSSEIIDALYFVQKDYPEQLGQLRKIFGTSDMVKFAKLIPDITIHTDTLDGAVDFVRQTKDNKDSIGSTKEKSFNIQN